MPKPKPPCKKCKSANNVKLLGGGTHTYYRYNCETCKIVFQAQPLHRQNTPIYQVNNRKEKKIYTCSRCGQKKKDHVCSEEKLSDHICDSYLSPNYSPPQIVLAKGSQFQLPFSAYKVSNPPDDSDFFDPEELGSLENSSSMFDNDITGEIDEIFKEPLTAVK
jgi:hypothetical protein